MTTVRAEAVTDHPELPYGCLVQVRGPAGAGSYGNVQVELTGWTSRDEAQAVADRIGAFAQANWAALTGGEAE